MPALQCHVAAHDLAANVSARSPRHGALRGSGGSGLHIRQARFHRARPSSLQQHRILPRAAAEEVIPAAVETNGRHQQPALGQGTLTVHAGERQGRPKVSDSLTTPIVQTSTYTFRDTAELIAFQENRHKSFEYGRYGNPTTRVVEEKLLALEGADDALLSASGMCSATTMLLALVPAGGHIVTTTDCYRRTRQFIQTVLPKMGITATVIDPADIGALERALEEHQVSLFFSESPTNPYLRCVDIPRISALCRPKGAIVCIDSTFATPVNQKAIALGADLVLHSATKYLAGHNDVLAGAIAGRADLVATIRSLHNVLGGVIDPHAAYLLLRGMKTLDLRVERHNRSATEIARRLAEHPKVDCVHYPGLASHPDHRIAKQQMVGYGGVISFEVKGDLWTTAKLIDSVSGRRGRLAGAGAARAAQGWAGWLT